ALVVDAMPELFASRVSSERRLLSRFESSSESANATYRVTLLKMWSTIQSVVKVCFFSGTRQLRTRITKVAMEWMHADSGLALDFGDPDNPRLCKAVEFNHIRIGYGMPGYWSLVGNDSIRIAGQNEQSMNLQEFDSHPPGEDEFRAIVLHLFGHA